jgi:hypothetical protein
MAHARAGPSPGRMHPTNHTLYHMKQDTTHSLPNPLLSSLSNKHCRAMLGFKYWLTFFFIGERKMASLFRPSCSTKLFFQDKLAFLIQCQIYCGAMTTGFVMIHSGMGSRGLISAKNRICHLFLIYSILLQKNLIPYIFILVNMSSRTSKYNLRTK